jgi:hypothetical protein
MITKIFAVILAYSIFVLTSLALFKISEQNPHSDPGPGFVIITIIYGSLFSFLAGLVAQLISKTKNLKINYVLAFIIAGFATFSLFKSSGNHWTQILAIFIFAPVSIFGGMFYIRRMNK